MVSKTTGFGAAALGLTVLAGVLVGSGTAGEQDSYWSNRGIIAAIVLSAFLLLVGGWSLGSYYLGWRWPDSHDERVQKRHEHELHERIARYERGHGFDELLEELRANLRDVRTDLGNDMVWGNSHRDDKWRKHRYLVDPPTQTVVDRAYAKLGEIDRRKQARYDEASQDEVNDPAWKRLKRSEIDERVDARLALVAAIAAVEAWRKIDPRTHSV